MQFRSFDSWEEMEAFLTEQRRRHLDRDPSYFDYDYTCYVFPINPTEAEDLAVPRFFAKAVDDGLARGVRVFRSHYDTMCFVCEYDRSYECTECKKRIVNPKERPGGCDCGPEAYFENTSGMGLYERFQASGIDYVDIESASKSSYTYPGSVEVHELIRIVETVLLGGDPGRRN